MTRLEALRLLNPDSYDRAQHEIRARFEDPLEGEILLRQKIREALMIACDCINKVELLEDDGK